MDVVINALGHMGGGGITLLKNLLNQWTKFDRDHDFHVFVKQGVVDPESIRHPNVHWHPVEVWSRNLPLRLFYEQVLLPLRLLQWEADVLFCTGDLAPLVSPVPTVLKVGNGMPFADDREIPSWRERTKFRLQRIMTQLSVQRAHTTVFVSDWLRGRVEGRGWVGGSDHHTVHLGFDPETFHISAETEVDPKVRRLVDASEDLLLSVSTVNPHKNFEVLFQAIAELIHDAGLPLELAVAGRCPHDAYFEKLQDVLGSLALTEHVHFLGQVPHAQISHLYRSADVFVHPSRIESFGHPFLEAMASDLPIVASRSTAIPEIVGDAGLLFDPDDVHGLAGLLYTALRNESARQALIESGRHRLEEFSWERAARRMLELIESAARGEIPAGPDQSSRASEEVPG